MKQFRLVLLAVIAMAVLGGTARAQLSGTIDIPAAYPSIAAAIDSLNLHGVADPGVTFNVVSGHTETAVNCTLKTTTGSATAPIVFQKSGGGVNPKITAASGSSAYTDGVIKICGTDYVTFDGIDINASGQNNIEWGYALVKADSSNGTQHCVIKNCTVKLNKTNLTSRCIYFGNHTATSTAQLTVTEAGGTNSYNKVFNDSLSGSYYGMSISGYGDPNPPYQYYDAGNEIGVDGENIISNFGGAGIGGSCYGIFCSWQAGLKLNNNTITGGNGTTGSVNGIYADVGRNSNLTISGNTVMLVSASTTAALNGIYNNNFTGTVVIDSNAVQDCSYTAATTGSMKLIANYAACGDLTIAGNLIANDSLPSSGAANHIFGIRDSNATGTVTIAGNTLRGLMRSGTSTGSVSGIYTRAGTITVTGNTIDSLIQCTVGGNGSIYGYRSSTSAIDSETISGNTIRHLVAAGSNMIRALYSTSNAGVKLISGNTVEECANNGTNMMQGIFANMGASIHLCQNRVRDLTNANASGQVYGMFINSGTTVNVYNNYISDLKTPASDSTRAIIGLMINTNTPVNVYDNTIYLDAASSSAGTFGTAGIYAFTAAAVDLRNNIVVNLSTPGPTGGATVAYRRSDTTLATYTATSNNNDFYAGAPDASHLIFWDGTTGDQTIGAFKSRAAPRDAHSFSENPPFVDVSAAPYDLRLKTTEATGCESGGSIVITPDIATDFDGEARYPNPGYPDNPSYPATAPDVGADEFAGQPKDAIAPSISVQALPPDPVTVYNFAFYADITDTSGISMDSLWYGVKGKGVQDSVAAHDSIGSGTPNRYWYHLGLIPSQMYYLYVAAYDNSVYQNRTQSALDSIQTAAVLPVELTEYAVQGVDRDNQAILSWATASENNTQSWIVERSVASDKGFSAIGTIAGSGTSTSRRQYRYVDNVSPGEYYYRLVQVDLTGQRTLYGPLRVSIARPSVYGLSQAYPTPFAQLTMINYQLPNPGRVSMKVYNALGQCVRTLVDRVQGADYYRVSWNGRDDAGRRVSAGVYLYRLEAGGFGATRKTVVLQ